MLVFYLLFILFCLSAGQESAFCVFLSTYQNVTLRYICDDHFLMFGCHKSPEGFSESIKKHLLITLIHQHLLSKVTL